MNDEFLHGGGAMGALIRATDWSSTPLGSRSSWPQSLRTAMSILLNSRYPMFVFWGPELVKIYNDGYRPITGAKHPWALGRPARQVWPEIWDTIGPMVERVIERGESTWSDDLMLFMERSGFPEEVYFTFSYSPIRDESGGIGGLFCACTETTDKVLGERRLRALHDLAAVSAEARTEHDACRLSSEVLGRHTADVPFSLLYLLEPDGRLRLVSSSGVRPGAPAAPLRLDRRDASGWPFDAVFEKLATEEVSPLATRFPELPPGPWPEPPNTALCLPLVAHGSDGPAGAIVLGAGSRRVLDEKYRDFLSLVAGQIATSIANARASEEERRRAEALAELDRAKTAFFANVSHEFRTPLTLILGPVEDGLRRGALSGAELESTHRNALRLLRLVNSLLEFARVEAGRAKARFVPVDLDTEVANLASAFRSAIEAAGLTLDVRVEPMPEPVFADRDMLEKIVLNLVSNAFKHTFEGGVEVELRPDAEGPALIVSDTGVGIAQHELPRVFDRFHRVENVRARTHEGSGIGLALVQDLVRLHGGGIDVESEVGRGSTFTVRLRYGREHLPEGDVVDEAAIRSGPSSVALAFVAEASRWTTETSAAGVSSVPGAPKHEVLLADDNADMRDYVAGLLAPHCDVTAVADGQAALEAARRRAPDLVLTDVMMPRLDGFGLIRELRADSALAGLPVIVLSARAGEEARVEGLDAGADDYLVKPFSARELLARVRTHLSLGQLREQRDAERRAVEAVAQRLEAALEAAAIGTYRSRVGSGVVEHDAGVVRIFGLDEPDRATLDTYSAHIHPEDRGGWYERLERCLTEGADFEMVYRVMRPDGSLRVVLDKGAMVTDETGAPAHLAGAVVDITEQVSGQRERDELLVRERDARLAAEEANRAKDEFLAMLGHELRNPLAPIQTALQLMALRGQESREREVIERQVHHLVRLIDDLLDVSRITRGKISLEVDRAAVADVLARAVELASPLLEQRRQKLAVLGGGMRACVQGDAHRLAQAVSNLLTNAAKYSDPGGQITLSAELDGATLVVSVRDHGIGISSEMLPRVFELFSQERQALDRAQGGLGLGLAIVKRLVEMHGGSVEAHSDGLGRGSTFTIRLPAVVVPAEVASASATPPDLPRAASGGLRVLIVDDNEDAAAMLEAALASCGYDTRAAHDGPAALRVVEAFVPDVAILDIGLPVMDGYELAARLRADARLARVHMLALTGYGQEEDRARAASAGFDAHLVKPIELSRLRAVIDELRLAP